MDTDSPDARSRAKNTVADDDQLVTRQSRSAEAPPARRAAPGVAVTRGLPSAAQPHEIPHAVHATPTTPVADPNQQTQQPALRPVSRLPHTAQQAPQQAPQQTPRPASGGNSGAGLAPPLPPPGLAGPLNPMFRAHHVAMPTFVGETLPIEMAPAQRQQGSGRSTYGQSDLSTASIKRRRSARMFDGLLVAAGIVLVLAILSLRSLVNLLWDLGSQAVETMSLSGLNITWTGPALSTVVIVGLAWSFVATALPRVFGRPTLGHAIAGVRLVAAHKRQAEPTRVILHWLVANWAMLAVAMVPDWQNIGGVLIAFIAGRLMLLRLGSTSRNLAERISDMRTVDHKPTFGDFSAADDSTSNRWTSIAGRAARSLRGDD